MQANRESRGRMTCLVGTPVNTENLKCGVMKLKALRHSVLRRMYNLKCVKAAE